MTYMLIYNRLVWKKQTEHNTVKNITLNTTH